VTLFLMWKPTMEQIGFSQWNHGTGRRARLMYMKTVNGQKKSDIKLYNSSTDSWCTVCYILTIVLPTAVSNTALTIVMVLHIQYCIFRFVIFIFYVTKICVWRLNFMLSATTGYLPVSKCVKKYNFLLKCIFHYKSVHCKWFMKLTEF